MSDSDKKTFETGQDTDFNKTQSDQPPAATTDDTSATQTGGFKQPEQGSDQKVETAGETTTLGETGTDIEGEASETNFVGSKGETDTSSELVDNENADKDGQPPLDGE